MIRRALRVDESLIAAALAKLANREGDARVRGRLPAVRYLRLGQPPHLTVDQVERFKERIRKGARSEDRVCVLRGMDVQRILQEEFEVECFLSPVYFLLHRLEFSSLVRRLKHEQAEEKVQAVLKKLRQAFPRSAG